MTSRSTSYKFEFESGNSWNYEFTFDEGHRNTLAPSGEVRAWTALDFHRCAHCPLSKDEHPQCPVAMNLDRVVEDSKTTISWTRAKVTVTTPERSYVKECATQDGLRSLFGLLMASSGCPHLDWLRPLARMHLPFATPEENLFRVVSFQLLEDFLNGRQDGGKGTEGRISERYKAVEKVNHTFKNRIRAHCQGDADKNAIAALDIFVQMFTLQLETNYSMLRKFFA